MTQPHPFIQRLVALVQEDDRAALAALRRGLGKEPGEAVEMYPYVAPFLPASRRNQDAYFVVAALFAAHRLHSPTAGNLGRSFRRLSEATDSGSIEQRFIALLNAHLDDLPNHLRHAVSLLASHEVPIDFAALLNDIRYWDAEHRPVQRRWARSYWQGEVAEQPQPQESAQTAVE